MHIPEFDRGRVLVAGDLMLDRYWSGAVSRISPEAPVPIVKVQSVYERPGGAGNVAVNLASLGVASSLLGICGDDEAGQSLTKLLESRSIRCLIRSLPDVPTITKLRIVSQHQQLIRLDFEETGSSPFANDLVSDFERALEAVDLVVLSDYAKGTLNHVGRLIELANERGKRVLVDPKGADFDRYAGAYLMTPNLSEFQAVVGPCRCEEELLSAGFGLINRMSMEALVVTRGEDGMTLLIKDGRFLHLPAEAKEVYDVTGAGDTVISTLAAALVAELPLEQAVMLANAAAGIVVGKLGTASVTPDELRAVFQARKAVHRGVVGEADLLASVQAARAKGERIVATNGCFDILHAGHVEYLRHARDLGDRLIVLVNGDESVRRLKGPERPLNSLQDRMAVLAALECVDWVTEFHEDTPKELICRILPDVLVKGGDYSDITQIAGHDCVLRNGGEVHTLGFKHGYSTSNVIAAIKGSN